MKRTLRAFLLLALFAGAGWETSKLLCEWPAAKPLLARLLGREPAALALDNLARVSGGEIISDAVIDREFDLLRHELADESAFEKAVEASSSSVAHTPEDTMDKISGESLRIVGSVAAYYLAEAGLK